MPRYRALLCRSTGSAPNARLTIVFPDFVGLAAGGSDLAQAIAAAGRKLADHAVDRAIPPPLPADAPVPEGWRGLLAPQDVLAMVMVPVDAVTTPTALPAPASPVEAHRQRGHPMLPPLMLSLPEAAAYLGVSTDLFLNEVADGSWPEPVRRGAKGRRLTWYRPGLDAAADRLARAGQRPNPDPIAAPPRADAPDMTEGDRAIANRLRASIHRAPGKRR